MSKAFLLFNFTKKKSCQGEKKNSAAACTCVGGITYSESDTWRPSCRGYRGKCHIFASAIFFFCHSLFFWKFCRKPLRQKDKKNLKKTNKKYWCSQDTISETSPCRGVLREDWELLSYTDASTLTWCQRSGNSSNFNEARLPDGHVQLVQQKGFWHVQRCHSAVHSSRFSATDGGTGGENHFPSRFP